jgi:hypothetical protein
LKNPANHCRRFLVNDPFIVFFLVAINPVSKRFPAIAFGMNYRLDFTTAITSIPLADNLTKRGKIVLATFTVVIITD